MTKENMSRTFNPEIQVGTMSDSIGHTNSKIMNPKPMNYNDDGKLEPENDEDDTLPHPAAPTSSSVFPDATSSPSNKIVRVRSQYLEDEWYRLRTFVMYPSSSSVSAIVLASKGFVYSDDTVMCHFCDLIQDDVRCVGEIDECHANLSTKCPMVTGAETCNNIGMGNRYPMNGATILSQFVTTRETSRHKGLRVNELAVLSQNTANGGLNEISSSQPTDQSATSAVITNATDLYDGSEANQNYLQNSQTPQSELSTRIQNQQVQGSLSTSSTSENNGDAGITSSVRNTPSSNTHQNNTPNETTPNNTLAHQNNTPNDDTSSNTPVHQNNTPHNDTPSNTHVHQHNTQHNNTTSNDLSQEDASQPISYKRLGIITDKPKRPEYAVSVCRLNSFQEWPKRHHLKPQELVDAGFFYTGSGDCTRCFHCGGGLRNWEPEDNVFVEHARWFPYCAFFSLVVGKQFVDIVQEMKGAMDVIKYEEVMKRMRMSNVPLPRKITDRVVDKDAAVRTVVDNGFDEREVTKLATEMNRTGEPLSSDTLFKAAQTSNIPLMEEKKQLSSDTISIRKGGNKDLDEELIVTFRDQISELRQQSMCKICLDKEVTMVLLPCGHFVSCTECSFALRTCPMCRIEVKGLVQGHMGLLPVAGG